MAVVKNILFADNFLAEFEHEAQRYIILQKKASGRYLVFYKDKDGEIVGDTVEDVRCATVFDTDIDGICGVMGNFPDAEWGRIKLYDIPEFQDLHEYVPAGATKQNG